MATNVENRQVAIRVFDMNAVCSVFEVLFSNDGGCWPIAPKAA